MLRFSNEAAELCPPNAPSGFPHIISSPEAFDEATDVNDIHFPDVVATHLYKWNPEALRKFLDLRRGKFEYVLERPHQLTLLVARLGQKIHVELHSDGYTEGSTTITYLLSTSGEWKPTFGYKDLSPTYNPSKIEEYAVTFATKLLNDKGWTIGGDKVHKVLWTKLPGEDGFKIPYDTDQQEFYGLPSGWEGMSDEQISESQREFRSKKPYEERDKWAFELIEPTVC